VHDDPQRAPRLEADPRPSPPDRRGPGPGAPRPETSTAPVASPRQPATLRIERRELLTGLGALSLAVAGAGCRANDAARERFADLSDDGPALEPISASERAARRARLGTLLAAEGADAILIEPGATMTYLADVSWGRSERLFALLVFADGSHAWICPAFEEGRARGLIDAPTGPGGEVFTWQEDEYAVAALRRATSARRATRVLVEPQVRHVFAERLSEAVGRDHVASGARIVARLRGRKDAHELALLRRANELTQRAIAATNATLEPGLTSRDVAERMAAAHARLGMRSPWCLALIGPAAALPHGDASDRRLRRGDVLLVDTGAAYLGYQSDITRTWVFGAPPDDEVRAIWGHVRDAQRAAIDAIRPGVVARDVDARARELIASRGFGPGYRTFTHRLGHGIGLEGHEDPYFDGGSDVVLEPGMTLSTEPGIYWVGRFGVRIEDIVAVTETGVEVFGTPQRGPEAP